MDSLTPELQDLPPYQRPSLAGEGRLRLPDEVLVIDGRLEGSFSGRYAEKWGDPLASPFVDPFLPTGDRLLLAESFARLDLSDLAGVAAWCRRHGVVDAERHDREQVDEDDEWRDTGQERVFVDRVAWIEPWQRNVAWLLATLAELSDRREAMDWDPDRIRLLLRSAEGDLVIGGQMAATRLAPPELRETIWARAEQDPGRAPEVRAIRALTEATDGWPCVTVGRDLWRVCAGHAGLVPGYGNLPEDSGRAKSLGSTWDLTVELVVLLTASQLRQATRRRSRILRWPVGERRPGRWGVVQREYWMWHSVLAPVHIQLFEGLMRITAGEPGAAICRECGQPFLVLDSRRQYYCNDRERNRFAQRERRRRLAADGEHAGS